MLIDPRLVSQGLVNPRLIRPRLIRPRLVVNPGLVTPRPVGPGFVSPRLVDQGPIRFVAACSVLLPRARPFGPNMLVVTTFAHPCRAFLGPPGWALAADPALTRLTLTFARHGRDSSHTARAVASPGRRNAVATDHHAAHSSARPKVRRGPLRPSERTRRRG